MDSRCLGLSQPLPVLHCVLGQVSALLGLGFLALSMDLIPACLFCRFAVRIYRGEALWLSDDPGSHQPVLIFSPEREYLIEIEIEI